MYSELLLEIAHKIWFCSSAQKYIDHTRSFPHTFAKSVVKLCCLHPDVCWIRLFTISVSFLCIGQRSWNWCCFLISSIHFGFRIDQVYSRCLSFVAHLWAHNKCIIIDLLSFTGACNVILYCISIILPWVYFTILWVSWFLPQNSLTAVIGFTNTGCLFHF